MPSYQTIVRKDEKTSLLGSEFIRQHPEVSDRPIIVETYHNGSRCEGSCRKRRAGCCARLCKGLFWTGLVIFALVYFLGRSNLRFQLRDFWSSGVPAAVAKCPAAPISYKAGELHYAFDVSADSNPRDFFLSQRLVGNPKSGLTSGFIQTAGHVVVQAAPAGTTEPITVDLDIKLSHEELADTIVIKNGPGDLSIESATVSDRFAGMDACISIIATVWVAPSANVSSFNIDTVVLPVELRKSLQLTANNVFIHSTSGSVSSETDSLDSRSIEVETVSSAISGSYPLADLLSLKTVSGAVRVNIEPKISGAIEHDGSLIIRSTSGTIEANTEFSHIPNRKYNTQIHTVSGTVSGSYLLGVDGNINSASGSIDADFYTAGDVLKRSYIINSVSGSIRSTIHDESYKLGTISSNVQSRSGKVKLQLPAAWEGKMKAKTVTGSIDIAGDGVTIIKDVSPVPHFGRVVLAEKGDGASNVGIETINGAISVRVG